MDLENQQREFLTQVLKEEIYPPIYLQKQIEENKVLSFARVDLEDNFQLNNRWAYLTKEVFEITDFAGKVIQSLSLSHITKVKITEGFSSHRLSLFNNEELLATLTYSHRQKRAMSALSHNIEKVIEEDLDDLHKGVEEIFLEKSFDPYELSHSKNQGGQKTVVWRLLGLLAPYKKRVALGALAAACMTLVGLVPAYLTGYLIDNVIKPFQSGHLLKQEALDIFSLTLVALIVTKVFREFFTWIRMRTMSILGEMVAKDLRDKVYSHLHTLSISYFSSKQTGSLISRVSSDTDRIWDFIAFGVVEVMTSLIMLFGLSMVLLQLDWQLGLLVSLPVPLILWAIMRHGDRMRALFLRCWRRWSQLTDCLSDTIPGIRVVKAFNKGAQEVTKFQLRNQACLEEFSGVHRTWTTFWPKLMLGIHAIVIAVWFFGVPRVLEHIEVFKQTGQVNQGLSPGEFVSFVIYMTMFIQPIEVIGQMARMVNRATSSAYRVFEVLDTKAQVLDKKDALSDSEIQGDVEFDKVVFSYDGVRKVLKEVSFKVKAGEMIGIVGPSGSGKTTITNLLARFYDPQSGEIKVDGNDITHLDQGKFREQLGMVLQEPYLFHGSLLENIRYGRPEATLREVIESAMAANAHDYIVKLPQGYDTIVGERGHTLSGGERQRVSIARAILRNPRILILDEATSSVDTETERKIQEALDRLIKGRTVFAIAHRLSTLAKADRIIVVKNGEIVEEGSHEVLLKKEKGVYKNLFNMQIDMNNTAKGVI